MPLKCQLGSKLGTVSVTDLLCIMESSLDGEAKIATVYGVLIKLQELR